MGVGIRMSLRHLYRFAEKEAVNYAGKTKPAGLSDGKRKKIGNLDEGLRRKFLKKVPGEPLAFSSCAEDHRAACAGGRDRKSRLDCLFVCLIGERFDDARRAEDGDSPENSQARVECMSGKFFALGDFDFNQDGQVSHPPEGPIQPFFSIKRQVQGRLIGQRSPETAGSEPLVKSGSRSKIFRQQEFESYIFG